MAVTGEVVAAEPVSPLAVVGGSSGPAMSRDFALARGVAEYAAWLQFMLFLVRARCGEISLFFPGLPSP